MTLKEAIQYSSDKLGPIYEQNEAEIISNWLVEHIKNIERSQRMAHPQMLFSGDDMARMDVYLQRLLTHEPVQYVLNEAWFFGMKFFVNKDVLIPRPETEELVDWIIKDQPLRTNDLQILDIGTGSGCIPVSLKKHLPAAAVTACDLSKAALAVAQKNADQLQVSIRFAALDFLDKEKRDELSGFDIIVSNPPYIPEKDKGDMHANVLNHEPHLALFVPDNDALLFYKAIADFGLHHLNKNGCIYLEIHEGLGEATRHLFQSKGYITELRKDMQQKDRMIKAAFLS